MTSGSLLPTICLVSSRADLTLKSQCVRHVECACRRNRHPDQCIVLNFCDPHCVLTGNVQYLLRGDRHSLFVRRRLSQDPPRNVLFGGVRSLISDFTWVTLRCDPSSAVRPSELHCSRLPSSRRRHQHDPHRLLESRLVRDQPSPLSSCRCSSQRLWRCWIVCLTLMILRVRPKDEVSDPALCPSQFSSEILTRDGKRHWSSSICLSLVDPWSHVARLHQPVPD